jgi:hypothetical protein
VSKCPWHKHQDLRIGERMGIWESAAAGKKEKKKYIRTGKNTG